MNKYIKTTLKIINTLIVTLTVIIVLIVLGTKLLGIQMFTVLSGSMEPEYPTGSLIFVKPAAASELEEGDVITYMLSETTISTHRIIEVENDEDGTLSFRTKGDANEIADAKPVLEENVIGTPVFVIPKLGVVMSNIQNPPGKYAALAIGLSLILFVFVTDSFTKDKKKKDEPESDKKSL